MTTFSLKFSLFMASVWIALGVLDFVDGSLASMSCTVWLVALFVILAVKDK